MPFPRTCLCWLLILPTVCSFVGGPAIRRPFTFALRSSSTHQEESPPSPLQASFQLATSSLIANATTSTTQEHVYHQLVKRGLDFGSHRRRFDFGGVWVRNATLGDNVVPFLMTQHGLNESWARQEATRPYVQRYRQVRPGVFEVDTDFGRRVTIYEQEPDAVLYQNATTIRRHVTWQGDTYITTTNNPDGSVEVTKRYLSDWNLVVEREYRPLDKSSIQCRQVFERIYGQGDSLNALLANQKHVLVSPLQRVPGCVANVKVRTILVDDESVVLDGEADAMVSRGLLALLSQVLLHAKAEHVLQLNPDLVADQLQLRNVLSTGRNDGLASMVSIVQSQIRKLLNLDVTTAATTVPPETAALHNDSDDKRPTVAMLLSGGVDSSVALNILKRQNYNITAFYLKIWLEDELAHLGQCPWEDDYRICQQVCAQAGVPLETISLQEEYKERVIEYTIQQAEKGRTPNPDIMCNSRVKFGCFYDAIENRGFDHVASGHYAQLLTDGGEKLLLRAPDPIKDQSYFLCALTQGQLQRVLFPIGEFHKSKVRQLAQEFDLPNKDRPDSQGLCFLGKVKFDHFLEAYLGERRGDIVDGKTGEVLGRHRGVWYHTVGQRKGIGLYLDPKATSRGPWYVVAKDPKHDIVFCSNEYDEEVFEQARSEFYVEDIRWIAGSPPPELVNDNGDYVDARFEMKIRHGPKLVGGTLKLEEIAAGNVKLDAKDGGLAPGQYVAFYEVNGFRCFGGGVISERHWARFLLDREETQDVVTKV